MALRRLCLRLLALFEYRLPVGSVRADGVAFAALLSVSRCGVRWSFEFLVLFVPLALVVALRLTSVRSCVVVAVTLLPVVSIMFGVLMLLVLSRLTSLCGCSTHFRSLGLGACPMDCFACGYWDAHVVIGLGFFVYMFVSMVSLLGFHYLHRLECRPGVAFLVPCMGAYRFR